MVSLVQQMNVILLRGDIKPQSGKGRNEKEEDEEKRVSRFPSSSHGTSGEESGMGIEGTEDGLCVPLDAESSVKIANVALGVPVHTHKRITPLEFHRKTLSNRNIDD
ncbi:hypothetical protein HZH68_008065 [Vespula germanica]|uniref:Uncharacterized protein n=3 Tax=Vespula TaxID=7451 RepID=A0A834K3A9_VESGE|nr:hypothetical protein HZH66_007340 [Vespula vulgaris]KAF7399473.1 hypothetical protein HZH68_008065 [Vespula germanica]KAF7423471.1 hypothetical protein H0235_008754 [Vespula pensylvanica]